MHLCLFLKKSVESYLVFFFKLSKSDKKISNKPEEGRLEEPVEEHHLPMQRPPTSAPGPRVDSVPLTHCRMSGGGAAAARNVTHFPRIPPPPTRLIAPHMRTWNKTANLNFHKAEPGKTFEVVN